MESRPESANISRWDRLRGIIAVAGLGDVMYTAMILAPDYRNSPREIGAHLIVGGVAMIQAVPSIVRIAEARQQS